MPLRALAPQAFGKRMAFADGWQMHDPEGSHRACAWTRALMSLAAAWINSARALSSMG